MIWSRLSMVYVRWILKLYLFFMGGLFIELGIHLFLGLVNLYSCAIVFFYVKDFYIWIDAGILNYWIFSKYWLLISKLIIYFDGVGFFSFFMHLHILFLIIFIILIEFLRFLCNALLSLLKLKFLIAGHIPLLQFPDHPCNTQLIHMPNGL